MAKALRHGGHFCHGCRQIVEPINAGEPNQSCPECDGHRISWYPGFQEAFRPLDAVQQKK
jgi:hypothetical protein